MIINLDSLTDLSGFYVVYDGSAALETSGIYGISHLMEHLICKNFDHLQDEFDIDGIDFNAYTSYNNIVFYITGLEDKLDKWRDKFIDLISEFNITNEEFDMERKIVLEEYYDSFSSPTDWHYLNLDRKLYNIYNPIGLADDLKKLTYIDCLDFYKKQFLKPSKIINVSNGGEFKSNMQFASAIEKTQPLVQLRNNDNVKITGDLSNAEKTSLIIKSDIITRDFAILKFINAMLSYGLNSPLYQEIREKKGLVYYISCYISRHINSGIIEISTLTSDDNVEAFLSTLKEVLDNPSKYLTQERFNIMKECMSVNFRKGNILKHQSVGKYINPIEWDVEEILDDLTLDKCLAVYDKYYDFESFYVSNSKTEFIKK